MQANNGLKMSAANVIETAEKRSVKQFTEIDKLSYLNQKKVLNAFRKYRIAPQHFAGSGGYGYDDIGKVAISNLYKDVFSAESAIVSPLIASGTHAIYLALSGMLLPGDELIAASGQPYDTLIDVINGQGIGSLRDFGVLYKEIPLKKDNIDYDKLKKSITNKTKCILLQRSRGYSEREPFNIEKIRAAVQFIKEINDDICIMVDNCYGEFSELLEPTDVGADIVMGSLIKNPGGGIAPTGGYIAGKEKYIRKIEYRLTAPGIGAEIGSYTPGYKLFFQGFFMAPHVTAQALKGSVLIGHIMDILGYKTMPKPKSIPYDIIRSVCFNTEKELIDFCKTIQFASPIDSFVTCEPWDMPGYQDKVIMAAGTFNQGASIELSCDAPIRKPYIAYLQGGLTYEHVKIAISEFVDNLLRDY